MQRSFLQRSSQLSNEYESQHSCRYFTSHTKAFWQNVLRISMAQWDLKKCATITWIPRIALKSWLLINSASKSIEDPNRFISHKSFKTKNIWNPIHRWTCTTEPSTNHFWIICMKPCLRYPTRKMQGFMQVLDSIPWKKATSVSQKLTEFKALKSRTWTLAGMHI